VTTIKPEELQLILTIEKHKISLLINTGTGFQLFLSLPAPGTQRKLLFRACEAGP
jgi:hypothetical protein